MLNNVSAKYLLPIGLLLLSMSIVLRQFSKLPDALLGFMMGVSVGLLLLSLIRKVRSRNAV